MSHLGGRAFLPPFFYARKWQTSTKISGCMVGFAGLEAQFLIAANTAEVKKRLFLRPGVRLPVPAGRRSRSDKRQGAENK
jgi:hypothetical protein